MVKNTFASLLFLLVSLTSLLPSLACPNCPIPIPPRIRRPPPPPPQACPPPPPPKTPPPPPPPSPPPPPKPSSPPPPPNPSPPPPLPKPKSCPPPPPNPSPPPPLPKPKPCPPPPVPAPASTCPIDTSKLYACVDLLGNLGIGGDAKATCCPVLEGLADADAALCLCTTIRAKLLGVEILMPIALELLVECGKHIPHGYQCPAA